MKYNLLILLFSSFLIIPFLGYANDHFYINNTKDNHNVELKVTDNVHGHIYYEHKRIPGQGSVIIPANTMSERFDVTRTRGSTCVDFLIYYQGEKNPLSCQYQEASETISPVYNPSICRKFIADDCNGSGNRCLLVISNQT